MWRGSGTAKQLKMTHVFFLVPLVLCVIFLALSPDLPVPSIELDTPHSDERLLAAIAANDGGLYRDLLSALFVFRLFGFFSH